MGKYQPLTVAYADSGLEKNKASFVLADDAFQNLENAFLWRGRIRRRKGFNKLGRLRRIFSEFTLDQTTAASPWSFNLKYIGNAISNVQDGGVSPSTITTNGPHGLSSGDTVTFSSVGGTGELDSAGSLTVTVPAGSSNTFTVTTATTTYDPSLSGGFYSSSRLRTDEDDAQINCGTLEIILDQGGGTEETFTDNGDGTLTGDNGGSGTINYSTWAVVLTHTSTVSSSVDVSYEYFPSLPVMGLALREQPVLNVEQTIAFDTKYAYSYVSGVSGFRELVSQNPPIWSGNDSDFFYTSNYWRTSTGTEIFWVTNFNLTDPIRYFDGNRWTGDNRAPLTFQPYLSDSTVLQTATNHLRLYQAKIIIPYKGRLVTLNTWEGPDQSGRASAVQHPQRARWSQNGDPTDQTDGWRSDVAGRGGFVDCPTSEHIVSAEFIRDTLIVAFERSTWILRYTGNEILPFVWERVNRELGSDSAFSMVAFDKGVLYVGDKSINSCDGNNVDRIDDKIPDTVFNIHNGNDGPKRVHGIRNFFERLVYWTYPDHITNPTYPDRMLVLNYENGTWAVFKDSFTSLGTYQKSDDTTWADLAGTEWQERNSPWFDAKNQADFPSTIAGNQQGYVLQLEESVDNKESLFIKDITFGADSTTIESPNHNLQDQDWVKLTGIVGTAASPIDNNINGAIYQIAKTDDDNFTIKQKPQTAITAITLAEEAVVTSAGHTLSVGQKVAIRDVEGMVEINGITANVTALDPDDPTTFTIDVDTQLFTAYSAGGFAQNISEPLGAFIGTGTYAGCGEIRVVQNFFIRSKKFNMITAGEKNKLGYIDWLVKTTTAGEVSCRIFTDYKIDDDEENNDYDTSVNASNDDTFFNQKFLTQEGQFSSTGKKRDWKRFYCPTDAQFFEFVLTLDAEQMSNPAVVDSQVWIDAFIIWSEKGGRLAE